MGTLTPEVLLRALGYTLHSLWCMPYIDARMEKQKPLHLMNDRNWCITYWLTDGRTVDTLNQLTQNMPADWTLEGQIEQGTDSEDKLHAQLFLRTPKSRGTRIAKYFPDCYINEAKNPFALKKYVHKEETRVAEFKTIENKSPHWSLVRDKFFEWVIHNEPFYGHIKDDIDERISPRLELWDKFINISIAEGMSVELVGVNPQYRSAIRRYWKGFISRAELLAVPNSVTSIGTLEHGTLEQSVEVPILPPPLSVPALGRQGGVVHRVKKSDLFAPL